MYLLLVFHLLISPIQDNISKDYFLEAGSIAIDNSLCDSIKWNNESRSRIKSLFIAYKLLLNNIEYDQNKKQVLSENKLLEIKKIEADFATIAQSSFLEYAATGHYVQNGALAIRQQTFRDFTGITKDVFIKIDSITIANKALGLADSSIAEFASKNKVDRKSVDLFCDSTTNKTMKFIETEISSKLTISQKHKIAHLADNVTKLGVKLRNHDIHMTVYSRLLSEIKKNNKYITKSPLTISNSLLRHFQLNYFKNMISLSAEEEAEVSLLNIELLHDLHEIAILYDKNAGDDKKTMFESWKHSQSTINALISKYDIKTKKALSTGNFDRAVQIARQLRGIHYRISHDNQPYNFTDEQKNLCNETMSSIDKQYYIDPTLYKGDMSALANAVYSARANARFETNQRIFNNIFNDHQKVLWRKEIGDPISKEVFIELVRQLYLLNKDVFDSGK